MDDLENFTNLAIAADNHNIGNDNSSWLDPVTWGEKFKSASKFTAVSIASGLNSFYTTGQAVGNFFSSEKTELRETEEFISTLDSDLAAYYGENRQAADVTGFVLGSLIPGLGATKFLNAGQVALRVAKDTGKLGKTMSMATGLLSPKTAMYRAEAAKQINASATAISSFNANTYKALASGFHQGALEALAAEVAITATMGTSPVLENQDGWDIAKNIATGGAVGSVLGGAFEAAKTFGFIKKAKAAEDLERLPYQKSLAIREGTPASDKIWALAHDMEMTTVPLGPLYVEEAGKMVLSNNAPVNQTLYANKIISTLNKIRESFHALTGDNTVLGNLMADMTTPIKDQYGQLTPGFADQYFSQVYKADQILTAKGMSRLEQDYQKALKKSLSGGETPELNFGVKWVALHGEDAGVTYSGTPRVMSVGDMFGTKENILKQVHNHGFSTKKGVLWDATTLTPTQTGVTEAELRHIWARNLIKMEKEMLIHENDIPLLERAFRDQNLDIKIFSPGEAQARVPSSMDELRTAIKNAKHNVAAAFYEKHLVKGATKKQKKSGGGWENKGIVTEEAGVEMVSKITNVRRSYLEGTYAPNEWDDLDAIGSAHREYANALRVRGFSSEAASAENPIYLPKYAKVVYKVDPNVDGVEPEILADALTLFTAKQKLYEQGAKNVFAQVVGKMADLFPDINQRIIDGSNRNGDGPTLLSGQNANYGKIGSYTAFIGSQTRELKASARKALGEELAPSLLAMGGKTEAAIEFSGINQKITRSARNYVLHSENGETFLVDKKLKKALDNGDGEVTIDDLMPDEDYIQINNAETVDFIKKHIDITGRNTQSMSAINAQQGRSNVRDSDVFRPVRPDLRSYQHFSFVVDNSVAGTGHKTMLHAASAKELAELEDRVRALGSRYKVVNKGDFEAYKKARQEYEYDRGMNENYIDSDMKNAGIMSPFFPQSDPQKIIDDILVQHNRDSDVLMMEAVRLRYQPVFDSLTELGRQHSKVETSKLGSRIKNIEDTVDNPYYNHVKTALDISKLPEHPLIHGAATLLDKAFSKAHAAITGTMDQVKTPADLDKINAALDEYGMKPAYYDAAMQLLVNHPAPKGELTKFVRGANSLLSLFTLGMDPLNALNNAIGSNILRMTELKHITRAIAEGNSEIAGELSQLAKIAVPGTPSELLAPSKLLANAYVNFFKDMRTPGKPLLTKYKEANLIKDRVEQLSMLVDDITLTGTETAKDLDTKLNTAFQRAKAMGHDVAAKGEKWSGNKVAEEMNRFLSANVMDQLTDLAVKRGLMDKQEAMAYINTFVNRVDGNMIASQRPLVFQGPIGQAIGLFQSYQFNLMQQLFRYVGEGTKKDTAMLLGLQSTLYGAQSMPGFQFVNTHIVGTASGNTEHRDLYDAAYGAMGKQLGDMFLYGAPSAVLQTNIYSRGDINPRHITILPTNLMDIPFISGWGKFFGNLYETSSKIIQGGSVWETILQGIEHNGISRPLAGVAQVMQGINDGTVYSTTNKGSMLYAHDLVSLASLSRLAGGRPLDEAVTNDALYRIKSYEAARREDLGKLAETIKTSLIQGNEPSEEQLLNFAQQYAKKGGKQLQFNKYMMDLYSTANEPQAKLIEQSLKNPFSYKMQLLMGGED